MAVSILAHAWMLLLCLGILGTVLWSFARNLYAPMSWKTVGAAVAPGLAMALSFYALALHMHAALGGWPEGLGEDGFPPGLLLHAKLTTGFFSVLLLVQLLAWPAALALCLAVPRARRFLAHLSLFGASFALGLGLMMLGPTPFLLWWWD